MVTLFYLSLLLIYITKILTIPMWIYHRFNKNHHLTQTIKTGYLLSFSTYLIKSSLITSHLLIYSTTDLYYQIIVNHIYSFTQIPTYLTNHHRPTITPIKFYLPPHIGWGGGF